MATNGFKVAVIGPKASGKTRLSNFVCNELGTTSYDPTVGVRILETERLVAAGGGGGGAAGGVPVQVELWDVSGDFGKYEATWPAVMLDLHGIVIVFDPSSREQSNEVKVWAERFVKDADLETGQAVIWAHGDLTARHKPLVLRIDQKEVSIPIVNVHLPRGDDQGDNADDSVGLGAAPSVLHLEFDRFLAAAYPFFENAM